MLPSLIALWPLSFRGWPRFQPLSLDPASRFTPSLLYQCEVTNQADLSYILAQVPGQINVKIAFFSNYANFFLFLISFLTIYVALIFRLLFIFLQIRLHGSFFNAFVCVTQSPATV